MSSLRGRPPKRLGIPRRPPPIIQRRVPQPSPSKPPPRPPAASKFARRMLKYVAGGVVVYGASTYAFWFWFSFVNPSEDPAAVAAPPKQEPEVDLQSVWEETAGQFDSDVNTVERTQLLWYLRRKLVKQASGHVLEVSAGTGRNFKYYNLENCKSITFLDQSASMLEIAKRKWLEIHPKSRFHDLSPENTKVAFRHQSALAPLEKPKDGYDTIIQTMGVCSTPAPENVLAHLGTLLNQNTGRILLIEHGRGHYDWINNVLNRDAHRHAQKFGCYHNRDIGKILEKSGLVVESVTRPFWWNLGTIWVIEARPAGYKSGVK